MDRKNERILQAVLGINNLFLGLVVGIVAGLSIFFATFLLVLKGGQTVGPHLSLLSQFFPGYSVTLFGSVVGLAYGFLFGYLCGWSIGWLYNRFVYLRGR
jgi:hypothetical protein